VAAKPPRKTPEESNKEPGAFCSERRSRPEQNAQRFNKEDGSMGKFMKNLFKSGEEKREEREIDRDVKVRIGKTRIKRHILHQQQMEARLTELGRKALALNDEARFKQIARQLLWTRADMQRWEKYVLSMEVLEARREQVKASVDLLSSVKAMSESMMDLTGPEQAAQLQVQLTQGLARAESLDERMSIMMEMMDTTLEDGMPSEDDAVSDLEKMMRDQNAQSDTANYDKEIEDGLRKIREEMKAQEKK
jgi:hypothetical protein